MRIKYNVTVFITLILFILSSCGSANELDDKTMEATIQAAIAATESVQNEVNDLISGSVSATLTAIPSPTPISVDQLSEEEFASALEQSTDEAVSTADNATQYASSASDDGELTQEEIDELYYLYYASVDELEQALYLVDIYYDLYDELLATVITDLESIEGELQDILTAAEDVLVYLEEFSDIISKGEQIAQEKIDQFRAFSTAISGYTSDISSNLPVWDQSRTDEFDRIADDALSTIPDAIADTKRGAVQIAREYLGEVKLAVGDGKFSMLELQSLSQLGANAAASLGQFGGEFAAIPNIINGMTDSFARGQLPQINVEIGSLQRAIPTIR